MEERERNLIISKDVLLRVILSNMAAHVVGEGEKGERGRVGPSQRFLEVMMGEGRGAEFL